MPEIVIQTDKKTEKALNKLFSMYGLSVAEAVNLFFRTSLAEKELPFKVWRKNYDEELCEAMKEMEEFEKNPELFESFTIEDIRNGNYRK
ncbi:MAG: type II toxin-antitoxin system RelB/DinJ family antitoxin [Candidatus Cloacimonetes bacterium]|nr:type II toxin-antitoxin system RelB/DinJ family antitoxin [Candidatus Cloacimonadota bacterium]